MTILFFETAEDALVNLSEQLAERVNQKKGAPFYLALSGGSTAKQMFEIWERMFGNRIDWDRIRFFWVDERCVVPEDDDSNYKQARELLFTKLNIPATHIYRIKGEADPAVEARRYSTSVAELLPLSGGYPQFDCIILGIGNDGHTASIFDTSLPLLDDDRNYAVSVHPVTGQVRVTMTGTLILNDVPLLIPVIGRDKDEILNKLLGDERAEKDMPASFVLKQATEATVFTDMPPTGLK